jgi:hypothetical protein
MREITCQICKDEGWVCEDHQDKPWNGEHHRICLGAGMPCKCNTVNPPWHFKGQEEQA